MSEVQKDAAAAKTTLAVVGKIFTVATPILAALSTAMLVWCLTLLNGLSTTLAELKGTVSAHHQEAERSRGDHSRDLERVRADVRADFAAIRQDVASVQKIVAKLEGVIEQHGKRLDRIEQRIDRQAAAGKSRTSVIEVTGKQLVKAERKEQLAFEVRLEEPIDKDAVVSTRVSVRPIFGGSRNALTAPIPCDVAGSITSDGRSLRVTFDSPMFEKIISMLKADQVLVFECTIATPQ